MGDTIVMDVQGQSEEEWDRWRRVHLVVRRRGDQVEMELEQRSRVLLCHWRQAVSCSTYSSPCVDHHRDFEWGWQEDKGEVEEARARRMLCCWQTWKMEAQEGQKEDLEDRIDRNKGRP